MIHAHLQEQAYWKAQKKVLRKNTNKLLISLEPDLYERLQGLILYDEKMDHIASELVIEGLDYIYMEDIPVRQYQAFQHFVEIKLSKFQEKRLHRLALKRGCSSRRMAYTILHFILKEQ
ncbi:hypothetical protein [Bacillus sp. BPN334]|uniref:hypothetical protein n=1 Tax=Bacillus sp. BPN334 TaxID=2217815 RepID=UPI0011EFAE83|nr:hypothetical protein [Bacillus sp. BPN334]KAA0781278.1 hypothetical protein DN393_30145 [Bacillus sp. BPN334]